MCAYVFKQIFMTPQTVLVAEDEDEIRDLLDQWLRPLGHTVHTVRNATEGLKVAGAHRIDLLVTDILMPDGDGLTLIEGLRKTQAAVRILAISGGGRYMDGHDYLRIAKGFGADAAIMKPFNRVQFLQALASALAPRETPPV
jgi:two-component system, chemotaxis family, chemotaxis protein CheY